MDELIPDQPEARTLELARADQPETEQIEQHTSRPYVQAGKIWLTRIWVNSPNAGHVLAWATVVLVVIAYWALVDTEATLELSERAWVGPSDAKIDAIPQEGKDVKVTLSVRNTGREPALDFTFANNPIIANLAEIDLERISTEYTDNCLRLQPIRRQQVLYPSTGFGAGFEFSSTIDKSLIDAAVVNGDSTILVRGCVAYRTFNKVHHSARFFYQAKKTADPAHLNLCAGGSDAD